MGFFGTTEVSILSRSIELTDAQIKAMPSTPIQLVEAPGAGKRIQVVGATVTIDVQAGVYTNISNTTLEFANSVASGKLAFYADMIADDSAIWVGDMWPLGLVQGAAALNAYSYTDLSDVENVALAIHSPNELAGNLTGGHANNSMRVTVNYSIVDV